MITYLSGIPPICLDASALEYYENKNAVKTALHVAVDPPTGVTMVSIYTDDGRGNGNCLISLPLCELRAITNEIRKRS